MQTLVKHLAANNLQEIASNSLLNCHAKGLHSIMLINKPEQRVRLFVTHTNHELWKNSPGVFRKDMSVAIHPHHCNVTLQCVRGFVTNLAYEIVEPDISLFQYTKFLYQSGVNNAAATFAPVGFDYLRKTSETNLVPYESISLRASDLHTVYCPKDQICAWFVFEGLEDPNYIPYCWSGADLFNFDSSELYQPMTDEHVLVYLRLAKLI